MTLKLKIQNRKYGHHKVYLNDDPGLTLNFLTTTSTFVLNEFVLKMHKY